MHTRSRVSLISKVWWTPASCSLPTPRPTLLEQPCQGRCRDALRSTFPHFQRLGQHCSSSLAKVVVEMHSGPPSPTPPPPPPPSLPALREQATRPLRLYLMLAWPFQKATDAEYSFGSNGMPDPPANAMTSSEGRTSAERGGTRLPHREVAAGRCFVPHYGWVAKGDFRTGLDPPRARSASL